MKGNKNPRKAPGFSWCRREFADGALSYTLFRRDEIRRVYQRSISFGPDSSRKRIALQLRAECRALRDRVDEANLALWDAAPAVWSVAA